jgi:hypothetical protein
VNKNTKDLDFYTAIPKPEESLRIGVKIQSGTKEGHRCGRCIRPCVTFIQFRIVEISLSDITEIPALVNVIESSSVNVAFLRSNIKYFGLVEQRNGGLLDHMKCKAL